MSSKDTKKLEGRDPMGDPCKHDDRIIAMAEDVAYIKATLIGLDDKVKGSIDDIRSHIGHGTKWRLSIVGVGAALGIFICTSVHWSGRLCEKIDRHEKLLGGEHVSGYVNDNTPRFEKNSGTTEKP